MGPFGPRASSNFHVPFSECWPTPTADRHAQQMEMDENIRSVLQYQQEIFINI